MTMGIGFTDRKVMADHLNEWMKYWDASIRNSGRKQ